MTTHSSLLSPLFTIRILYGDTPRNRHPMILQWGVRSHSFWDTALLSCYVLL